MPQDYALTHHAASRPLIWQIVALSTAVFMVILALTVADRENSAFTPSGAAITQIEDWHGNVRRSQ